jgi:hypothetical protein
LRAAITAVRLKNESGAKHGLALVTGGDVRAATVQAARSLENATR